MNKLLILFFCLLGQVFFAQDNYPVPPQNKHRLFYIQHNQNTNTYVYDANVENGKLKTSEPIYVYRMVYAEDGSKKELTGIQRRLAYGIKILSSDDQKTTFHLNGYPTLHWELTLKNGKYQASVTVNKTPIVVEKMFVQTKEITTVDYILISGKNSKNQEVTEKFIP